MNTKKESQTTTETVSSPTTVQPEKTAIPMKPREFEDSDVVTVIWKSWGTHGMPSSKVTYFDRHQFVGGVGRRIPYKDAKKWKQQGHGVHILPVDATETDFIKITGHTPMSESTLETMLKATAPEKIAALLTKEQLEKIAAMQRNQ